VKVRTPSLSRLPRSPRSETRGRSPRSVAEGIGIPSIVHPIHVDKPVGGVIGIGDDGGAGPGTGLDGATACPTKRSGGGVRPAKRSEDGIAHRVVAVGEGLAAAVVGVGQAVEFVPFASLQGGCALVGVGDDAGGGGVDGPAGGGNVVGPGQGVGHHPVADAQGHGVDSGPGVDAGQQVGAPGKRAQVDKKGGQIVHPTGWIAQGHLQAERLSDLVLEWGLPRDQG
jgi:hypothetical protein